MLRISDVQDNEETTSSRCRNVWNSFLHTKVMCSFNAKKESKQNLHLREELGKLVEPDMLEWLIDEMAQNRTKIAIKQKACLTFLRIVPLKFI